MKETKIWWDFTSLLKYLEINMIPRGLALQKCQLLYIQKHFLKSEM